MKMTRMYTGKDGVTHLEDLNPAEMKLTVKEIVIGANTNKLPSEWHNAPARMVMIVRQGKVEVEVEDGTKRELEAGDLLLAEDLTGKGHRALKVNNNPVILSRGTLA